MLLAAVFTLIVAFAIYQVLNWNFFPWLNLSIVFGSSLVSLIFTLITKIQTKSIKVLILTIATLQLSFSSFLLSQPEILRENWQWLFFPPVIVLCALIWDLFSKKNFRLIYIGRAISLCLIILSFLKFLKNYNWLDYTLIGLIIITILLLLFSKNNQIE